MNTNTKICTKCGKKKLLSEFHKDNAHFSGLRPDCKQCALKRKRIYDKNNQAHLITYREKNKEKIRKQQNKYTLEHKKEIQKYREKNKGKISKQHKQYELDHKIELKKKRHGKYLQFRNKIIKKVKIYYKKNKKKILAQKAKYFVKKYNSDPIFKIICNCRRRIHHALKDNYKSISTIQLLGCSTIFLKRYIESQFTKGMSWDNYKYYGWHIDHIKPLASFDLSKKSEQFKACHYSNLQPLWWHDNFKKHTAIND